MRPALYPVLFRRPLRGGPDLDLNFAAMTVLDPRITYSGASLATLTDAAGAIAYKPHNLILQSGDFTNATWSKIACSVTANATTDPDGTTTASYLVFSSAAGVRHYLSNPGSAASPASIAVYAKSDGSSFELMLGDNGTGSRATFNLTSGTVTSTSGATATITPVRSGWYLCQAYVPSGTLAANNWWIGGAAGGSQYFTGDDIHGVYIWRPRLNAGSSLQPYYPTTSAAYFGPRFTYDPVTHAALGLLVEEQRTNLFLQSRDFSNAAWTKQASASTAVRNAVGVDGIASSASTITESAGYFARSVYQSVTGSSGAYSTSVSFQQAAGPTRYLRITVVSGPSDFGYVTVNLKTGAIAQAAAAIGTASAASATVTYQPSTGMWRVSLSCALAAAPTFVFFVPIDATPVVVAGDYGRDSYTGDGSTSWVLDAAQFEPGAFATTPIHTTSASVTRAADSATITGSNFSSWFNAARGTFVVDVVQTTKITTLSKNWMSANDATLANRFQISSNNVADVNLAVASASASQANITGANLAAGSHKIAARYAVNDFALVVDGTVSGTDVSGVVSSGVNQLNIGTRDGAQDPINNCISRLRYYNTALTNAQLQALTT